MHLPWLLVADDCRELIDCLVVAAAVVVVVVVVVGTASIVALFASVVVAVAVDIGIAAAVGGVDNSDPMIGMVDFALDSIAHWDIDKNVAPIDFVVVHLFLYHLHLPMKYYLSFLQ